MDNNKALAGPRLVRRRHKEDHSCLQDGLPSLTQAVSAHTTSALPVPVSGILLPQASEAHRQDPRRQHKVVLANLPILSNNRLAFRNSSNMVVQQPCLHPAMTCANDRIRT